MMDHRCLSQQEAHHDGQRGCEPGRAQSCAPVPAQRAYNHGLPWAYDHPPTDS